MFSDGLKAAFLQVVGGRREGIAGKGKKQADEAWRRPRRTPGAIQQPGPWEQTGDQW